MRNFFEWNFGVNPVPSVYLYSALVQLLSTLIVDEDITLVIRYVSTLFTRVNFTGARTEKLRDCGNPHLR